MGVYKRGHTWWIRYTYNEKQVRESAETTSKKKAEQLLRKRETAIFERRFDMRDTIRSPLFSEYADHYLNGHSLLKKKPKTHERDKTLIAHLKAAFSGYRLNEIQAEMVEQYQAKRLEVGRAPGTVNREVACLKNIFTHAIRNRRVISSPVKNVPLLREDNEVTRVLSEEDEAKLLAAASPHIRAVVICALDSGMRLGEVLGLTWDCVDLGGGLITVKQPKTGRTKVIPITERLRQTLKDQAARGIRKHVFWWQNGKPIGRVTTGYKAALRRAGLAHKKYRFHDLRHTYATRLVECDVNPFTVMELLGHVDYKSTQRYVHPSLEGVSGQRTESTIRPGRGSGYDPDQIASDCRRSVPSRALV